VLDEDLPRALDVLTDLVRHPVLRTDDLELERKVVLEEISTVDDTPDDLVFELHSRTLWPSHSYGYSILGTRDTVGGLTAEDLRGLHQRAYHPRHVIITATGSVDHDLLLKLAAKSGWITYAPGPGPPDVSEPPAAERTFRRVDRDSAQTHIVLGSDTFPYGDRRKDALLLLNTVLGSGMSSRLFQRVREELGLAYSVFTHQSFYRKTGLTGVYVGTHPSTAQQAMDAILEEFRTVAQEGLSTADLAGAKQQLKGQVTLSLESPTARMYRLATIELYQEPYRTIDQVLADINAVTMDEVAEVAGEFFDPDRQTTVWLGPNE
jgi:predicted Zn-dependent peptidase